MSLSLTNSIETIFPQNVTLKVSCIPLQLIPAVHLICLQFIPALRLALLCLVILWVNGLCGPIVCWISRSITVTNYPLLPCVALLQQYFVFFIPLFGQPTVHLPFLSGITMMFFSLVWSSPSVWNSPLGQAMKLRSCDSVPRSACPWNDLQITRGRGILGSPGRGCSSLRNCC